MSLNIINFDNIICGSERRDMQREKIVVEKRERRKNIKQL